MGYFKGKKWPCLFFFAAYLVLAVMGSFTFSRADIFLLSESWEKAAVTDPCQTLEPDPENIFAMITYSLDCVAEEAFLTGKDNRSSPSPRFEIFRLFMPGGINGTGSYHIGLSTCVSKQYHFPILKNSIPANLRI